MIRLFGGVLFPDQTAWLIPSRVETSQVYERKEKGKPFSAALMPPQLGQSWTVALPPPLWASLSLCCVPTLSRLHPHDLLSVQMQLLCPDLHMYREPGVYTCAEGHHLTTRSRLYRRDVGMPVHARVHVADFGVMPVDTAGGLMSSGLLSFPLYRTAS